MMKVYNSKDGTGIALDLINVEAILELPEGYCQLVTDNDTYVVKADFDCVVKAVEHEKDARCI